jgi:hypothetical protein
MGSFRETKRQARRHLHQWMSVSALYLAPGSNPVPLPITVRLHVTFAPLGGDIEGGYQFGAERHDTTPRIVFLRSEITGLPNGIPARNSIISVETGEAYRVSTVRTPDDVTVTAEVTPLSASETIGLPVPTVI